MDQCIGDRYTDCSIKLTGNILEIKKKKIITCKNTFSFFDRTFFSQGLYAVVVFSIVGRAERLHLQHWILCGSDSLCHGIHMLQSISVLSFKYAFTYIYLLEFFPSLFSS